MSTIKTQFGIISAYCNDEDDNTVDIHIKNFQDMYCDQESIDTMLSQKQLKDLISMLSTHVMNDDKNSNVS